ncbi:dephospho-CoA kinase [Methylomonas paludis]|uniref:Dephospho-CoA kinase n=1 Tax=Methylomonas paludis TaxID=1173101 RepID=A0A975RAU7_9GAMM|nr:dephospho-CoA kinase [Methylomonas paludis]QWF71718.1 dephospho-CoA kinase [Methylomonas paludis]
MLKIGLTGGIGSGKSTVCRLFAEQGITIIDADLLARQLVEPGQPALTVLAAEFGPQILQSNGSLDRAALRDLVFTNAERKRQLESILHPLIYAKITTQLAVAQGLYCIAAVPLLLETWQPGLVDRVLVVDCSPSQQIERVMQRDQLSRMQALAIMDGQMSRLQRLASADDVLDNSTTVTQLAEQIKRLHNSYILLASVRISSA